MMAVIIVMYRCTPG